MKEGDKKRRIREIGKDGGRKDGMRMENERNKGE